MTSVHILTVLMNLKAEEFNNIKPEDFSAGFIKFQITNYDFDVLRLTSHGVIFDTKLNALLSAIDKSSKSTKSFPSKSVTIYPDTRL